MATSAQRQYARVGGAHVAYETFGDRGDHLVLVPDGFTTLDAIAELPAYARFRDQLASFCQVTVLDHRGLGLSDPIAQGMRPTLELWAEDLAAVADAVGSSRTALLGIAEGGFGSAYLAATRPDLVSQLILVNSTPTLSAEPFASSGEATSMIDVLEESIDDNWGGVTSAAAMFAPSAADDADYAAWLSRTMRRAASPAQAKAIFDLQMRSDIRAILPTIQVPTLVIHRAGNTWFGPEHGRFLAASIPGARYVELPGRDHVPYLGDSADVVWEIEEFVTGARTVATSNRVLSTLLFTDIVTSTDHVVLVGDARWRELLDLHDELCRAEVERTGGTWVKSTGDGVLARFDGPHRAIQCAQGINSRVGSLGLQLRFSVHTGEIEIRGDDVGGVAVHIAARILSLADPGEILTSRTVKDLTAGSGIEFVERGEYELKGVPERWVLYAATSRLS